MNILPNDSIELLIIFGGIVAIVGVVSYFRYKKEQVRMSTIKTLAEKGLPIPESLIDNKKK